jgi:hypothetical protein
MANPINVFSFASMVYPTFTMLAYAGFVAAVLLAADWYVWGRTYATNFRTPRTVKPQGDLVERFLVRAVAVNETHVPLTEMNPVPACVEDDRHGFKRVA